MSGNSFAKVYWIRHDFEVEHDSQRKTNTKKTHKKKTNKKNKYFSLPNRQLAKTLILNFGL